MQKFNFVVMLMRMREPTVDKHDPLVMPGLATMVRGTITAPK